MVQFLNDKDGAVGKEFWNTHKTIFQNRAAALATFKQNPHKVQSFLGVSQKYSDIGAYLTTEQWFKVAGYIFENARRVGTMNFYIDIFKLIFGDNADIHFDLSTPTPGVLGVTITYVGAGEYPRVIDNGEQRVIVGGDIRVVTLINNVITIENIRGVLSKIVPSGIFTKITIKAISGEQNE